ncbi:MAG: prop effector [Rhodoferax sp.]|nr:prop effector [Rhodoferax sp.]OIP21290.1 MAG: prop effector [Comamonadaceae bacterium CG2_30_60_41]PIW08593.1 MAG: prop effector [Comamonadaceae bacterium CG17_big_fil_post_rev_8_21_14_2_50_60_13]PIY25509.1 MAG: prop effector [Comamonadaceae bacterium CG_4_10_14_3_um_filter_60_75]PJC13597.1 MAG: prop effector [Comamonadaceae bacterium CG_4_9_14_0_8_um_filter_60_18]
MTESVLETTTEHVAEAASGAPAPAAKPRVKRFDAAQPVLEKLFTLYPHLFGQRFLPLKLGVFQDLMAAHPDVFKRDDLKLALGVHTRSTRYLQAVAAGLPRHDLQGQVVETVAPEHVFLSIVEVFTRRQARAQEDLLPKLQNQLATAYEKSGLTRADYLARIGTPSDVINAVLDEAMAQVDLKRARRTALVKAFEASGKTVAEFADSLGMPEREVQAVLTR